MGFAISGSCPFGKNKNACILYPIASKRKQTMPQKNSLPKILIISELSAKLKQKLEECDSRASYIAESIGEQGIEALSIHSVDLVLLHIHSDWQPDIELLRHIRIFFQYLPVVILAESSTLAVAEACAGLSTQGYLRMPASSGEIWRAIDNALFIQPHGRISGQHSGASRSEVARALSIIHAQHQTGLKPTEVAQQVHMSRNHLGELFKYETGHTLSEYINKCRASSAMRSITKNPSLGFSQVADQTGFSSESYFSKVFRKVVGMTPKEFRQNAITKGSGGFAWCEKLVQGLFAKPYKNT
jgi:two-component system response regulator YesN